MFPLLDDLRERLGINTEVSKLVEYKEESQTHIFTETLHVASPFFQLQPAQQILASLNLRG